MAKLRLGIVGTGFMGQNYIKVLYNNPLAEIVALVDKNKERVKRVANTYNIQNYYTKLHELFDKNELDAIIVATPEDQHKEPVLIAAENKAHILVEKPIAHTLTDAMEMINIASENNVILMVGHILRFDPRYSMAKEMILQGKIGNIISICGRRLNPITTPLRVGKWTDPMFYLGIHDVDLMLWYVEKEVSAVYAKAVFNKLKRDYSLANTPDVIYTIIEFSDGILGSLEINWILPKKWGKMLEAEMHVYGTKGALFIDVDGQGLTYSTENDWGSPDTIHWPSIYNRIVGDLKNEVDSFIDCIINRKEPPVTGEDGLKALKVTLAIIESYRKNKEVILG